MKPMEADRMTATRRSHLTRRPARRAGSGALVAAAALLGLAACTQPFDASAPYSPMQAREGYSYLSHGEGRFSGGGSGPGARFQDTPAEVDLSQENPWANPGRSQVSLCHSSLLDERAELVAEATRLCGSPGGVEELGRDTVQNACPLLQPQRVTFLCLGPDGERPAGYEREEDAAAR